jgi:hypothetical protein
VVGQGRRLLDQLRQCLYDLSARVASRADDEDCRSHCSRRIWIMERMRSELILV